MKARRLVLFVLATVASVLSALAIRQVYTWRGNTHPDVFIEWMGSRAASEGGNPYSEETTLAIQIGSKGQRVPPNKDQLAFIYPFYRIFLNAPLAFLPYEWATAVWQTVMQVCLLVGVPLFVHSLGWQATIGCLTPIALVTIAAYPIFGGLALGQMAVGPLALLLVVFWALRQGHDWIAGSRLALVTVKPQLIALVLPGLLLWCLLQRRWRVVLAFAIALGLLTGESFAVFPSWLGSTTHTLPPPRPRRATVLLNALLLALVVVGAGAKIGLDLHHLQDPEVWGQGLPLEAASYLQDQEWGGRMFNTYNWGGYLIWSQYPDRPVSIDGRIDLYALNSQVLEDYVTVHWLRPGWQQALDQHDIGFAITERPGLLDLALAEAEGWDQVYSDEVAVIYVRAEGVP